MLPSIPEDTPQSIIEIIKALLDPKYRVMLAALEGNKGKVVIDYFHGDEVKVTMDKIGVR